MVYNYVWMSKSHINLHIPCDCFVTIDVQFKNLFFKCIPKSDVIMTIDSVHLGFGWMKKNASFFKQNTYN